ncbi:hypothetical protein QQP08_013779 [Theobroma cacao]|nr:hypothetical protein QQP08_013779 [Theobroma cacao]
MLGPKSLPQARVVLEMTTSWEFCSLPVTVPSSALGSKVGESFHQTEPCPSIVPLPLIVIPFSFVNSIHCNRPDPQAPELVGAMILPSNCVKFDSISLGIK